MEFKKVMAGERMIYLVDIDGTVADLTHRLHFIQQKPADWDRFFKACPTDLPITNVINVIKALKKANATILMVTGRSMIVREQTKQWLESYAIPYDGLYMRREGDHREDNIVKAELLDHISTEWNASHIAGVFEDRQQVVDMYRARGLKVFQVAPGNF